MVMRKIIASGMFAALFGWAALYSGLVSAEESFIDTFARCGDDSVDSSCNSVHGFYDDDDCRTAWILRADAVALHREQPLGRVLFDNPDQPSQNLRGSAFDFGYKPGADFSLVADHHSRVGIELRYLRNDAWGASGFAQTEVNDRLRINTRDPIFLTTGREIAATYDSSLENFELNVRRRIGCGLTWFTGVRYVELDERFHADLVDDITPNFTVTYDTAAQNRLYGGQIGFEQCLLERGRWSLDLNTKLGVYYNCATQHSQTFTGAVTDNALGGADSTSLVGEVRLTARVCITDALSFRGGYGTMSMSGLVTATDQMQATSFVTDDGIDAGTSIFYHGGFLGLEYQR